MLNIRILLHPIQDLEVVNKLQKHEVRLNYFLFRKTNKIYRVVQNKWDP